jgi:SAM-dependent methyltransferase
MKDEGGTRCPVCSSGDASFICRLPFRGVARPRFTRDSSPIDTDIHRCHSCGSYWRVSLDVIDLANHFSEASYTKLAREENLRAQRASFFEFLVQEGLGRLVDLQPPRVLDVGCSYGHLLQICHELGCRCWGVEPVGALRARMNTSTIATVFPDLRDVPTDLEFDLVFLIDSLYYFPQPTAALRVLAGLVGMGGCIVIRITNRTPLLDFLVRIGMSARISRALFGDEIVAFSHRGMKKAISEAGLRIEQVLHYEHKSMQSRPWRLRLMYWLLPVVSRTLGWRVSPGLIYVCSSERAESRSRRASRKDLPARITASGYVK